MGTGTGWGWNYLREVKAILAALSTNIARLSTKRYRLCIIDPLTAKFFISHTL
jgi:hypothetical protein